MQRRTQLFALGAAVVAVVAVVSVWLAARQPVPGSDAGAAIPGAVRVAITAKSCDPNDLSVPAGQTTFQVVNRSDQALEWEILKGVIVVAERENIAPGFTQRVSASLEPGDYDITCGLLTNPKGKLHVAKADAGTPPAKPTLVDLIGPLAEYKVYIGTQAAALADGTRALADAVKVGDVAAARSAYLAAHGAYERLKPLAPALGDLDARIDPPAAPGAASGFAAVAASLFGRQSTADLAPVADRLVADVAVLGDAVKAVSVMPAPIVNGVSARLRAIAGGLDGAIAATAVADTAAGIDGARKVVDLFRPLTDRFDTALAGKTASDFAAVDAIVARYLPAAGKPADTVVTAEDRAALKVAVTALADDVQGLVSALGLG